MCGRERELMGEEVGEIEIERERKREIYREKHCSAALTLVCLIHRGISPSICSISSFNIG